MRALLTKAQAAIEHPLEFIVVDMLEKNEIVDVSGVAARLSRVTLLNGNSFSKGNKAYRIVAADVLRYMTAAGRLTQHDDFVSKTQPEAGGPWFS